MSFEYDFRGRRTGQPPQGVPLSRNAQRTAIRLLNAIYEKTGGRGRAVRDVTELETGLTAKAARDAWRDLLREGLIERFSLEYAARISHKGIGFIESGGLDSDPLLTSAETVSAATAAPRTTLSRKVFVVHGQETGARDAAEQFLEDVALQAILLDEPADSSRNITEEAEMHRDVDFAVVLLTPHDLGLSSGGPQEIRPRLELLLELGYFIGRLGRSRVCVLAADTRIDAPAQVAGVLLESFDASGAWKSVLTRELRAAGYVGDWENA